MIEVEIIDEKIIKPFIMNPFAPLGNSQHHAKQNSPVTNNASTSNGIHQLHPNVKLNKSNKFSNHCTVQNVLNGHSQSTVVATSSHIIESGLSDSYKRGCRGRMSKLNPKDDYRRTSYNVLNSSRSSSLNPSHINNTEHNFDPDHQHGLSDYYKSGRRGRMSKLNPKDDYRRTSCNVLNFSSSSSLNPSHINNTEHNFDPDHQHGLSDYYKSGRRGRMSKLNPKDDYRRTSCNVLNFSSSSSLNLSHLNNQKHKVDPDGKTSRPMKNIEPSYLKNHTINQNLHQVSNSARNIVDQHALPDSSKYQRTQTYVSRSTVSNLATEKQGIPQIDSNLSRSPSCSGLKGYYPVSGKTDQLGENSKQTTRKRKADKSVIKTTSNTNQNATFGMQSKQNSVSKFCTSVSLTDSKHCTDAIPCTVTSPVKESVNQQQISTNQHSPESPACSNRDWSVNVTTTSQVTTDKATTSVERADATGMEHNDQFNIANPVEYFKRFTQLTVIANNNYEDKGNNNIIYSPIQESVVDNLTRSNADDNIHQSANINTVAKKCKTKPQNMINQMKHSTDKKNVKTIDRRINYTNKNKCGNRGLKASTSGTKSGQKIVTNSNHTTVEIESSMLKLDAQKRCSDLSSELVLSNTSDVNQTIKVSPVVIPFTLTSVAKGQITLHGAVQSQEICLNSTEINSGFSGNPSAPNVNSLVNDKPSVVKSSSQKSSPVLQQSVLSNTGYVNKNTLGPEACVSSDSKSYTVTPVPESKVKYSPGISSSPGKFFGSPKNKSGSPKSPATPRKRVNKYSPFTKQNKSKSPNISPFKKMNDYFQKIDCAPKNLFHTKHTDNTLNVNTEEDSSTNTDCAVLNEDLSSECKMIGKINSCPDKNAGKNHMKTKLQSIEADKENTSSESNKINNVECIPSSSITNTSGNRNNIIEKSKSLTSAKPHDNSGSKVSKDSIGHSVSQSSSVHEGAFNTIYLDDQNTSHELSDETENILLTTQDYDDIMNMVNIDQPFENFQVSSISAICSNVVERIKTGNSEVTKDQGLPFTKTEGSYTYGVIENVFKFVSNYITKSNEMYLITQNDEMFTNSLFETLPLRARHLYSKLLTRKYSWIRVADMKYPEISKTLITEIDALAACGFVTTDLGSEDLEVVLSMLQARQLKDLCSIFRIPVGAERKVILISSLIKMATTQQSLLSHSNSVSAMKEQHLRVVCNPPVDYISSGGSTELCV